LLTGERANLSEDMKPARSATMTTSSRPLFALQAGSALGWAASLPEILPDV
jgi:hypothetical protein